ncbi:Hypothetical protein PBC10988_41050 [Planctomycetales bacterium 10988]|nr:Hypothetical protein PBC10988_41050 [Planctomycetales bacterium 10988]
MNGRNRESRTIEYALTILLCLKMSYQRGPLPAPQIAEGSPLPRKFRYKILRSLVDAGLLRSSVGPGGGYLLARAPHEIALREIFQAVGFPFIAVSLLPLDPEHQASFEEINAMISRHYQQLLTDLAELTLADLQQDGESPETDPPPGS